MPIKITAYVTSISTHQVQALLGLSFNTLTFETSDGPQMQAQRIRRAIGRKKRMTYILNSKAVKAIMSQYRPEGAFNVADAQRWMQANSLAKKTASPTLSRLQKEGFVEHIGTSQYKFLKPHPKAADHQKPS